jgi:trans-aconitate methyltransferase
LPWHCVLAGSTERSPEYSQQVAGQIQSLALEERITMAGELDDQALRHQYQNADLFVLPSLYEGYGMVIDEALAAGLPVITTDGGALANTGNRPGVRQYPAGSVNALKDCLEACLSDRQSLQDLAEAARQSRESVRQWPEAADDFLAAMAQLHQTRDHSQFDQQWLSLREPADHRARSQALLEQVRAWRTSQKIGSPELHIADLGAGAGSNGVYLSEKLPRPQRWTLLDQDSALLAEACQRMGAKVAGVEGRECTLEAGNLNELIPADTHLITASALIDLASADWLDALADTARARQAAVFIVLSYAGEFQLTPEHPDDDLLRSLVNDHQHGDKGSGAALGPQATDYLKGQLETRGFDVAVAPSPWLLERGDEPLQAALMSGWCEAAKEQCPAEQARIDQWQAARLKLADQGALKIRVAHYDLFARPGHD